MVLIFWNDKISNVYLVDNHTGIYPSCSMWTRPAMSRVSMKVYSFWIHQFEVTLLNENITKSFRTFVCLKISGSHISFKNPLLLGKFIETFLLHCVIHKCCAISLPFSATLGLIELNVTVIPARSFYPSLYWFHILPALLATDMRLWSASLKGLLWNTCFQPNAVGNMMS